MNSIQIESILEQHKLWLSDPSKGSRIDLKGANLQDANLYGANLQGAILHTENGEVNPTLFQSRNLEYAIHNFTFFRAYK